MTMTNNTAEAANKDKILNDIAPCAFCCYTCVAMKGGAIEESAKKLNRYLEGYYEFNKANLPFKYRGYNKKIKSLREQLDNFSESLCGGCRNGADKRCCITDCFVADCTKAHGVDFCGECSEFPCTKGLEFFKGATLEQWKSNNKQIKEKGIEEYHKFATDNSHYKFYVD